MEIVGEVHEVPIRREFEFEWRIKNFSSLLKEEGERVQSPLFLFAGETWCLNLESIDPPRRVGVFLRRESSGSPMSLTVSLGVKAFDGKKVNVEQFTHTFEEAVGRRSSTLVTRCVNLKMKTELVPSDILTLICALNFENDSKSADDGANEKLLKDLANLIVNEDHSDVTISVKSMEFRLHRNILAARNPYFRSMFKTEMKEKITGTVTIDDCEPDIFQSFINFLYTGKAHTLSCDNVCALYEVATKYQEDQLKAQCLSYMKNKISVDSFCDFVALALKHDEEELLKNATKLFCRKSSEIIKSVKWNIFLKEYPFQANELYFKSFKLNAEEI